MSANETPSPDTSPPAASAAAGRVTWTHKDSDPTHSLDVALSLTSFARWPPANQLSPAVVQSLGGASGAPMTSTDRLRFLRAQAVATQYVVENATMQRVAPQGEMDLATTLGRPIRGDMFYSRAHCYAASTVARSWQLLAGPGKRVAQTATTLDGQPAVLSPPEMAFGDETGLAPLLLGAVLVVAVIGFTVALCYNGQATAAVIDHKLTEDALTARMLASQGAALTLVDNHSQREIQTGHPIPYSRQEIELLDALTATQRDIASREQKALPNPFMGAVDAARKAADKAGLGIGAVVGIGLALGGVAYVMGRNRSGTTTETSEGSTAALTR